MLIWNRPSQVWERMQLFGSVIQRIWETSSNLHICGRPFASCQAKPTNLNSESRAISIAAGPSNSDSPNAITLYPNFTDRFAQITKYSWKSGSFRVKSHSNRFGTIKLPNLEKKNFFRRMQIFFHKLPIFELSNQFPIEFGKLFFFVICKFFHPLEWSSTPRVTIFQPYNQFATEFGKKKFFFRHMQIYANFTPIGMVLETIRI